MFIKLYQGNFQLYEQYLTLTTQLQIIAGIFLLCLFLSFNQFNLQDKELLRIFAINILIKTLELFKYEFNLEQNFEKLLECRTTFDVFMLFNANPKQFFDDFAFIFTQKVILVLDFINEHQKKLQFDQIQLDPKQEIIKNQPFKNYHTFNDLTKVMMTSFLRDIIQQKKISEMETIDYFYLEKLLKVTEEKLKMIKLNNVNKNNGDYSLRSTKNFRGSENIQILTRQQNMSNYITKYSNQLESTKIFKISQKLVEQNKQSLNIDTVLRDFFQEPDKNQELSSSFLHGQIEGVLGFKKLNIINNRDKQVEWIKSDGEKILIEVRDAPDKLMDTIENKISRKSNKHTPDNVPQCVNLIKDFKRNSLIFEREQDIFSYVDNLQTMFGINLNEEQQFEEIGLLVRIKEVKNGFQGIDSNVDTGDYRDLKIIQEMMQVGSEIVVNLESQLNLAESLLWKESEHIIQDVTRAEDDLNAVQAKLSKYNWMEGSMRLMLNIFKQLLITAAVLIMSITTYYVYSNINVNQALIQHANGKKNVSFVSGVQGDNVCTILSDQDSSQLQCFGSDENSLSTYLQNNKSKFKSIDNIKSNGNISLIIQDDKLTIYDKFLDENIIPKIKYTQNDIISAYINDSDENSLKIKDSIITSKKIQMVSLDNKLASLPVNNKLVQSTSYEYTCYSSQDKTECFGFINKVEMPQVFESGVNVIAAGPYHACMSNDNLTHCFGQYASIAGEVPANQGASTAIAVGFIHSCFLKAGTVTCVGNNDQNQCDIPFDFNFDVDYMVSGYDHVCLRKPGMVICIGNNDSGQIEVPNELKSTVDFVGAGEKHTCFVKDSNVTCIGNNNDGQLNIPADFVDDVRIVAVGFRNTCVLKQSPQIVCIGQKVDLNQDLPSNLIGKIEDIKMHTDAACIAIENKLKCQELEVPQNIKQINNPKTVSIGNLGIIMTKKNKVNNYGPDKPTIPTEFSYEADIIESGLYHTCFSNSTQANCFGENTFDQLLMPAQFLTTHADIISTGHWHTCMLNRLVAVDCFGRKDKGQTTLPADSGGSGSMSADEVFIIALGGEHTCMATNSELQCWGLNDDGQTDLPGLYADGNKNRERGLVVAAGGYHTCMGYTIGSDASDCIGSNAQGQLDIPDLWGSGVEVMGLGMQHTCFGRVGEIVCFGKNENGQTDVPSGLFDSLQGLNVSVDRITANEVQTCVVVDQSQWCFNSEQLPFQEEKDVQDNVVQVAATQENDVSFYTSEKEIVIQSDNGKAASWTLSLDLKDDMMCMFQNYSLGTSFTCLVEKDKPNVVSCLNVLKQEMSSTISQNKNVLKLECGESHVCAIFEDNYAECAYGSLLQNEGDIPKEMQENVLDLQAGFYKTCIKNYLNITCQGKEIRKNLLLQDLKNILEINL